MNVPNYIPQPLEVPGNISQASWKAKLLFLRRVTTFHLASVTLLVALACAPLPITNALTAGLSVLAILFLACVARIVTRGTAWDQRIAAAILPVILASMAALSRTLALGGVPIWSPLIGLVAAALYTALCGRDFSFLGQYALSLIASEVTLAVLAPLLHQTPKQAGVAMLLNGVYLSFFSYDLASLMSRRRESETLAAVVDLYRDVLNVFGWTVRCIRHWKRHRIWVTPWN